MHVFIFFFLFLFFQFAEINGNKIVVVRRLFLQLKILKWILKCKYEQKNYPI